MIAEPIFFEPFRVACPHDHVFSHSERIALSDIERGPLLLMEDGHCLRDQTLALCTDRATSHRSRHASSLEMLRHMIAAGEGISIIPTLAANELTTMQGMIAYRELVETNVGRTIALVRRTSETRADDLREIAIYLREALPQGVFAPQTVLLRDEVGIV